MVGYEVWVTTHNEHLVAGVTLVYGIAAMVAAPLFSGILDSFSRRTLVIVMNGVQAVVTSVIPVLLWLGHLQIWVIFIVTACEGVGSVQLVILQRLSIPELVSTEKLSRANSVLAISQSSANICGPALGGMLIPLFGIPNSMILNAASYALCLSGLLFVRFPYPARIRHVRDRSQRGIHKMELFPKDKTIFLFGLLSLLANVGFSAASIFFVPYALDTLHVGARGLGWSEASMPVGALAAGLFGVAGLMRHRVSSKRILLTCLACEGLLMSALGAVRDIWYFACLLSVISLFSTQVSITAVGLLQRWIPKVQQGRGFSFIEMMSRAGQFTGYCGTMIASLSISTPIVFGASGIIILLSWAMVYIGVPRDKWVKSEPQKIVDA